MTPSRIRADIVAEKAAWVRRMLSGMESLPLASLREFTADTRTSAAAESYLRRALEALLDLGRHVLAKGFGHPVAEYKEIPEQLRKKGILGEREAALLREMAGYRNRMVHFYDEIGTEELFGICAERREDVALILSRIVRWINAHPELTDGA